MFTQLLARVDGDQIAMIAVGGSMLIGVVCIVSNAVHRTIVGRQKELSRREIAAYVAEGSMTSDDAAKLLADNNDSGCCGGRKA